MGECGPSSCWVQITPGTISDHSMMPKVGFFFSYPSEACPLCHYQASTSSWEPIGTPGDWHEPWGGVASPVFLGTASLASTLVVTAPGEELSSLFPVAETEIEGGRAEQAQLQCANWAHNKFLTHLGVPPPGQRHHILHITATGELRGTSILHWIWGGVET